MIPLSDISIRYRLIVVVSVRIGIDQEVVVADIAPQTDI